MLNATPPETVSLPPGQYYVGDPCYVFANADWAALLSETRLGTDALGGGGRVPFRGRELFAGSTEHGDGVYEGSDRFDYGVDSGLLGAVPVELASESAGLQYGTVVDAAEGLVCSCRDGVFKFEGAYGALLIDTSSEFEEFGDTPWERGERE
jgi:hypothetical protein